MLQQVTGIRFSTNRVGYMVSDNQQDQNFQFVKGMLLAEAI